MKERYRWSRVPHHHHLLLHPQHQREQDYSREAPHKEEKERAEKEEERKKERLSISRRLHSALKDRRLIAILRTSVSPIPTDPFSRGP